MDRDGGEMTQSDVVFLAELFERLAREELQRGAVWMAELAARLAHRADSRNPALAALVEETERARRRATDDHEEAQPFDLSRTGPLVPE